MVPGRPRRLLRNGSGGGSAGTDPLGAFERCCASSVKPSQQEGWDRKQHSHVSTPWTFQVQALPGMTIDAPLKRGQWVAWTGFTGSTPGCT